MRGVWVLVVGVWLSLVVGCVAGPGAAFALSEGRSYELVSPPYKAGYGVTTEGIEAVALDGDSVAYVSQGSFAGQPAAKIFNMYLARRGGSGWSSEPLEVPSDLAPLNAEAIGVRDFSPSLQRDVAMGALGGNAGVTGYESPERVFLLHDTDTLDTPENWQVVGPLELLSKGPFVTGYITSSPDLCHVLFSPQGNGPLLEAAVGTNAELYDLATGCTGESVLRLVGLDNAGKVIDPPCAEWLGGFANGTRESTFNAVADGGREIFFSAFVEPKAGGYTCGLSAQPVASNPSQLFVRLDGERTVEVSRPLSSECTEVPCAGAASRAPALFWGASEDGSKVFFTTTSYENKVADNVLYMATIGCPSTQSECDVAERNVTSLAQVSNGISGGSAEVQGVLRIANDGSRVYFVARGVLSESQGPEGRAAVRGADNVYMFESSTGHVSFVTDLCSGAGLSGTVAEARCPADLDQQIGYGERNDTYLWESGGVGRETQLAGPEGDPGRFLVFSSYGRLIARGAGADTDDAKDVYRYDAVTGELDRVSLGEAGYDANGNCNDEASGRACDARIAIAGTNPSALNAQDGSKTRAVSDDGSRVVFESVEPLSSVASNGVSDVYEWHESMEGGGSVSLVSSGSSPVAEEDAVMSPSGDDIFFVSAQGLLPQDTDGQPDVYDARLTGLNGGFPSAPAEEEQCAGDACQGPLTNPAPLLVPGSVSQTPGDNFPASKVKPKPVKKKTKAHKAKKKTKNKNRKTKAKKAKGKVTGERRGLGRAGSATATGRTGR